MTALLAAVASIASLRGSRKFRPNPSATFTTSPRLPSLGTSSFRITSMDAPLFSHSRQLLVASDYGFMRSRHPLLSETANHLANEASGYCALPANGNSAMLRACLMADDKRRW